MKLDVIIPSHRREYRIADMARNWLDRHGSRGANDSLTIYIACEESDMKMYTERLAELGPIVRVVPDNYKCYVEAANRIAKVATGDAMIIAADDVVPCQDYDVIIEQSFRNFYPTFDGVLKANDLIHTNEETSNTHPVIGRKFYDRFGYVYYPGYFALYADTDLAYACDQVNRMERVPHLVLEHQHHSIGKTPRDFTHEKPLSQNDSGERLFNRRKEEGFPVFKDGKMFTLEEVCND